MNRSIQKVIRFICFFVGIILLVNAPVVLAQKKLPYHIKPFIWEGKITIERVGSADKSEDEDLGGKQWHSSVKTTFNEKAVITLCGEVGRLYIKNVKRTYIYTHKKTYYEQFTLAHCPLPPEAKKHGALARSKKYPSSVRKPGDWHDIDKSVNKNIYVGEGFASPKEMTKILLSIKPNNEYSLQVSSDVYTTITELMIDTRYSVCDGKSKVHKTHIRTCGKKDKPETIVGDNVVSIKTHPQKSPLGFISPKGSVVKNNSIKKDNMIVSEIKPKFKGDYQEVITASYELKAKDPCKIVYRNMMYSIAMAEAFSNKILMNLTESMEEYLTHVGNAADEIFKSDTGIDPKKGGGSDVRMSTKANCTIIYKDENNNKISKDEYIENRIAKKCRPHILFKESYNHENRHVYQCNNYNNEFLLGVKEPKFRGNMEVSAYIRGIKTLFYWLKQNCDSYDLANIKQRIKNLETISRY